MDGFGWYLLAWILGFVPHLAQDAFYDWFAKNRFTFFGGTNKVQAIPK
jgi:predicted DCC family thiol-disulfide oxidoreductase YuxK